jgi:hypothetical protein
VNQDILHVYQTYTIFINLQVLYQPANGARACKVIIKWAELLNARSAIFQQLRDCFNGIRRIAVFILGQRDIDTVDDEDHAHFFVHQILVALKERNCSNFQ